MLFYVLGRKKKNAQGVGRLVTYGPLSSHSQSKKENFIIASRKVQSSFPGQGTLGDQGISETECLDSASFISVFVLPLVALLRMTGPEMQCPKFKCCATSIHFSRAPLKQMTCSAAVAPCIQILLEAIPTQQCRLQLNPLHVYSDLNLILFSGAYLRESVYSTATLITANLKLYEKMPAFGAVVVYLEENPTV